MALSKPPDDPDLKNIIDKLANFVARNGPEFERMTQNKQKDNPKFSFLFGGEYFNYYQYKVTTEQAILNQQKKQQESAAAAAHAVALASAPPPVLANTTLSLPPGLPPHTLPQQAPTSGSWPGPTGGVVTAQLQQQVAPLIQQLATQKDTAARQIKQSEENLAAQYNSLIQQQQIHITEAVIKAREDELVQLCEQCGTPMSELDGMAQPIIESCTKDAISAGKSWIFSHNPTQEHGDVIAKYILKRVIDKEAEFELKLHLIYLMNDVLHHCVRKNADDLKKSFEKVVTPVFCSAHIGVEKSKQDRLVKLLGLWEKNSYFAEAVIQQMKDPVSGLANYQANLITEHGSVVTAITQGVNNQYNSLQKQHQDFVNHLNSQITSLETHLAQQQALLQQQAPPAAPVPDTLLPPPGTIIPILSQPPPGFPPPGFNTTQPPLDFSKPPPGFPAPPGATAGPPGPPATGQQFDYGHGSSATMVQDYNHGQGAQPMPLPDLSKPPPGFNPTLPPPGMPGFPPPSDNEADLMPTAPYHDLPAGLMAPLVKLEDSDYKPLDPKDIRLPPPQPPSERLLAAVEAFYSAPSHDNPRDAEGWEKLGLYEFFKAKKKAKELTEKERSTQGKATSPKRSSRSKSRSLSPPRRGSRSRSRSFSPPRRKRYSSGNRASRSPSPYGKGSRSPSPAGFRRRSRSRSMSRTPPRRRRSRSRSGTPPMFNEPFYAQSSDSRLGSENKGFSLLQKMGWGGAGLGKKEQGIVDPIKEAEVRAKIDMRRGLGVDMQDPFEQFRKSRSAGYIERMKARAETTGGDDNKKKKKREKSDD